MVQPTVDGATNYRWCCQLEKRFHAFEKVIHSFNKGVHIDDNNIIFILLGSSFCEGSSHFWIKGFTFMKEKIIFILMEGDYM